jgi:hypothetical protein
MRYITHTHQLGLNPILVQPVLKDLRLALKNQLRDVANLPVTPPRQKPYPFPLISQELVQATQRAKHLGLTESYVKKFIDTVTKQYLKTFKK